MKITLDIQSAVPLDVIVANFPKRLFVTDTSQAKIRPTGGSSSSHPMSVITVTSVVAVVCSYNHETLRGKSDFTVCPECHVSVKDANYAAPK